MKKWIVFFAVLTLPLLSIAQREIEEDTPHKIKDRIYFGGGFGINSGSVNGISYFDISLSPIIGYMITPQVSAGTGINWQRTSYETTPSVVLNQWGVSPFVRYNFNPQFFTTAEYNYISTPTLTYSAQTKYSSGPSRIFNRLLLGIGYSQPLGKRGAINAVGLYDVLFKKEEQAFASPWVFRVFFSF